GVQVGDKVGPLHFQQVGQTAVRQLHGDDQAAVGGPDLVNADQAGVREVADELQGEHLHAGLAADEGQELQSDVLAGVRFRLPDLPKASPPAQAPQAVA